MGRLFAPVVISAQPAFGSLSHLLNTAPAEGLKSLNIEGAVDCLGSEGGDAFGRAGVRHCYLLGSRSRARTGSVG